MPQKKLIKVRDVRISNGYYTYKLEVIEPRNLTDVKVFYGDMSYFDEANITKTIDEAIEELKREVAKILNTNPNNIEVEIIEYVDLFFD